MRHPSWLEQFGTLVGNEHSRAIDRRARLWLGAGWTVSALLGFFAPLYRGTTHIHGGAVVGAAVFVMIAVATATRRPMVCLTMSASGLIAGSAIGFGLAAALSHRAINFAITAQMAIGAVFLGRLFLREIKPQAPPPEDSFWDEVRSLPPEEARAMARVRFESLHREAGELNRKFDRMSRGTNIMLIGCPIVLLGVAILLGNWPPAWGMVATYGAIPFVAIGGVLIVTGARMVRRGVRDE